MYIYIKMAASILRTQRLPGEEAVEYCRRRNRAAGQLCRDMGLWSARWFARAVAWNNHLLCPRNDFLWSATLIVYRGKLWLERRRASFFVRSSGTGSCAAGRTGTRSYPGAPCVRWHDGIEHALSVL